MSEIYDATLSEICKQLEEITGKDMGDFGGWEGLKKYCLREWKDNDQVIYLIGLAKYASIIEDCIKEREDGNAK